MRFICYGKKLENMYLSIQKKTLGSQFITFEKNISENDTVFFVCDSKIWGRAKVSSAVHFHDEVIWKDKLYPYRASISQIVVFQDPVKFKDLGLNSIFKETLGPQWAFKILFTPGEIPVAAHDSLNKLSGCQELPDSEYDSYFSKSIGRMLENRRVRLGLKG